MLLSLSILLSLGATIEAAAISARQKLQDRQVAVDNSTAPYTLPQSASNPTARAQAIAATRQTFVYGPDIAGNSSYYPAGPLGNSTAQAEFAELYAVQSVINANSATDAAAAVGAAGGLKKLSDYGLLYDNQWKASALPGPYPGILSNYTEDLYFSMERLSLQPYSLRRVNPTQTLAFTVDSAIVHNISGVTLQALQSSGRLFFIDYSSHALLPKNPGHYAGASQAFFFIHPATGDFLPLAIKPNVAGSDLVYTPADAPNDWLLAKMMFNVNDLWHGQWYHLASTHEISEIVFEAAVRTMSADHPVLAILNRLMLQCFAIRISAIKGLLEAGGPIDELYPWDATVAADYVTSQYHSGAGAFQSNYFVNDFTTRGLLNCTWGPPLKTFPFASDASVILVAIRLFMTTFVHSYYPTPSALSLDTELQAWIAEALPACIIDFPAGPLTSTDTLVDILTHVAYLVSISHHTINTNVPVASSATLPFHPTAFYQPLPTTKGVNDTVPFLPQAAAAAGQIGLFAAFARPKWADTNMTLAYMFQDPALEARMNPTTEGAAKVFQQAMTAFSGAVRGRGFDARGLSLGMPFVWTALDPLRAPFFSAV